MYYVFAGALLPTSLKRRRLRHMLQLCTHRSFRRFAYGTSFFLSLSFSRSASVCLYVSLSLGRARAVLSRLFLDVSSRYIFPDRLRFLSSRCILIACFLSLFLSALFFSLARLLARTERLGCIVCGSMSSVKVSAGSNVRPSEIDRPCRFKGFTNTPATWPLTTARNRNKMMRTADVSRCAARSESLSLAHPHHREHCGIARNIFPGFHV